MSIQANAMAKAVHVFCAEHKLLSTTIDDIKYKIQYRISQLKGHFDGDKQLSDREIINICKRIHRAIGAIGKCDKEYNEIVTQVKAIEDEIGGAGIKLPDFAAEERFIKV